MFDVYSIINDFNQNAQQQFIGYLKQKNKRKDTKNIQLFKLLSEGETDSKQICFQLYGSDNKNAYHALRKRLIDALIDFTANKNLEDENSIDMQIIKYILASRTFLLHKNYSTAYKLLDRAEQLADEHSLFPILNEIYHTKIQYAPNYPNVNLNDLIAKQSENRRKHQLEDQLNSMYAKLKTVLNSLNYQGQTLHFETLLNQILKDVDIEFNESLSFKSLYQILAIADISAFITTKYYEIEDFVLNSYDILKKKKETDKQLYYQIHNVYIIANTLFRNKKFELSMTYIDEMEQLMHHKRQLHHKDFILKHTLVKALNLNYSNRHQEAIALIEFIINKKHPDIEALLDLHLTLLMFYFQQENFKKAKSIVAKFYHTDKWYIEKAGMDWVIKKNIAEILLYIELQDDDLFYSRLKSFRRHYANYLKQNNQQRILDFLKIAERIYNAPHLLKDASFATYLKSKFEINTTINEDIFVISTYAWLKSKVKHKTIYQTTLELIKIS